MSLISRRLHQAIRFKEKAGADLLRNREFVLSLKELKKLITITRRERKLSGITDICSECGREDKDCCGKGIELRYSTELLLINLMLCTPDCYLATKLSEMIGGEVTVACSERPENSCYFLSKDGCILLARDVFCVNFICDKIRNIIPLERISSLQELEGKELELIFRLEEFLKRYLKNLSSL